MVKIKNQVILPAGKVSRCSDIVPGKLGMNVCFHGNVELRNDHDGGI